MEGSRGLSGVFGIGQDSESHHRVQEHVYSGFDGSSLDPQKRAQIGACKSAMV